MRIANGVEHPLEGQANLDPETLAVTHVHAQPVPVRVEELVRVEKACDAGEGLAWEKLEEGRKVLRADVF